VRLFAKIAAAITAVGILAISAPPAHATQKMEAPWGKQCGAYLASESGVTVLRYWNCGNVSIVIEVDYRYTDNGFRCVWANYDRFVEYYFNASHAWYIHPMEC
jgi:hypothetical protein